MGNRHHALQAVRQANGVVGRTPSAHGLKLLDLCGSNVYDIAIPYTLEAFMRTNIVIDDSLMNQALKVSGYKTKKETVEEGLKLLIAQRNQLKIRDLRGKLNWEGDLDQMRTAK